MFDLLSSILPTRYENLSLLKWWLWYEIELMDPWMESDVWQSHELQKDPCNDSLRIGSVEEACSLSSLH